MRSKKGMESVEVWMWVIAGLVIGAIIFGSGYVLFSNWIRSNELSAAYNSFSLLSQSVIDVCKLGTDRSDLKRYVFPKIINNLSIRDIETGADYSGNSMCVNIEGEGDDCVEFGSDGCVFLVYMNTVEFESEKGFLHVVQKALKQSVSHTVDFQIIKSADGDVCIYHDMKFEDSDISVQLDLSEEEGECRSNCDCGSRLLCDESSHCCPEKYHFDGTSCIPYKGDGDCQLYVEENCEDEPSDCACLGGNCCPVCDGSNEKGCCPAGQIICGKKCLTPPSSPSLPGEICSCDVECDAGSGLLCKSRRCECERGYEWIEIDEECRLIPQCRDTKDNDGDGLIDFPEDQGCDDENDSDEFNIVFQGDFVRD